MRRASKVMTDFLEAMRLRMVLFSVRVLYRTPLYGPIASTLTLHLKRCDQ